MNQHRKAVIVGTGDVGCSAAYALLLQNSLDELILIDLDQDKAIGEVLDLQHALPFIQHKKIIIKAADYQECHDADVVIIAAGAAQKPQESRLDLTAKNIHVLLNIVPKIMLSGFNGILIVASNPVDLLSYAAWKISGLPYQQVIGTGTILDSARVKYLLSEALGISSASIHAYVLGEHGDSAFVPWSCAMLGTHPLLSWYKTKQKDPADLIEIEHQVRQAANQIIELKQATCYGIGAAIAHLVQIILCDERKILSISTYQNGQYSQFGLYAGTPCILGKHGVEEMLVLPLTAQEKEAFMISCTLLKERLQDSVFPWLI